MTVTASIGHNSAGLSPFDAASIDVDALWTEARHWLDGETVKSQTEADSIAVLLDMARKAKAKADDSRKVEAKPFDDGKAEVQARYKPIIGRCDTVADAAKKALAPFLAAQEAEKRAAEAKARAEAGAAQRIAQEAFAAARSIEDRERAEQAAEAAKRAEIAARAAEHDKGKAKGGARAVSLRTTIRPEITDLRALMAWIWTNDRSALVGFAAQYAAAAFRAGQRNMDGVTAAEEKSVA